MSQPNTSSLLPQEVINRIIDQVGASSDKARKNTLRAWSTVSRAIHCPSQKHVFSEIVFLVDDSANRRAARLKKVLSLNSDLASSICSLRFIFKIPPDTPSRSQSHLRLDNAYRRSKRTLHIAAGRLKLWVNHISKLLELFAQLPLRKLELEAQGDTVLLDWRELCQDHFEVDFTKPVFRIITNPTLHSLSFTRIVGLPASFLTGMSQPNRIEELVLRHAYFTRFNSLPLAEGWSHIFQHLTNIRSLTMINQVHVASLPLLLPNLPPSTLFPHLTTLVVSLPSDSANMNTLIQFILGVSGALKTLELHDSEFIGSGFDLLQHNYLGQFSALRRLNFKTKSFRTISHLHTKLGTISNILVSATSPIGPPSITVELHVDLGTLKRWDGPESLWERGTHNSYEAGWTGIDKGLANPIFVDLETVNLNLKMFHNEYLKGPTSDAENLRALLPRIHASPSIEVNLTPLAALLVCKAIPKQSLAASVIVTVIASPRPKPI